LTFDCSLSFVLANELESTGTGLSENRGQVLNGKPAMEAKEDKPVIASSKSRPHGIAIKKVVKGNLGRAKPQFEGSHALVA